MSHGDVLGTVVGDTRPLVYTYTCASWDYFLRIRPPMKFSTVLSRVGNHITPRFAITGTTLDVFYLPNMVGSIHPVF